MARQSEFSLNDLYRALNVERCARGLSWAQAAREIGRIPEARSISPSTLAGLRSRTAAEGDGVLQMLLWLRRSPESFIPEHPAANHAEFALPDPPARQILRFDTQK